MKHISILACEATNIASLDNPRRGFQFVNDFLQKQRKEPQFKVQIVGLKKEIQTKDGLYTLLTDVTIKELKQTDLILIPAFSGDINSGLRQCTDFIPWIIEQHQKGAEVASLCVGAFLLAATGLLNGKTCSTHWRAAEMFQKTFPEIELVTERIITDENGIYTSGGAFSAANLVLYLIEKYAGREAAIACSKMFQIDFDRQSQLPFIIFQGQKDHEDETVLEAQQFIEKNYREKISVTQLTKKLAISRRSLERRFKKATDNTIVEYIQRVKIEVVKKHLENGCKTISEMMYDVGYQDAKAFRDVFKKITGLTPVAYKRKFNKVAVPTG